MVWNLAVDIFMSIHIDTVYDEELNIETEDIFDDFRYDVLEDAVLDAIQEAVNKVSLDFAGRYRDRILRRVASRIDEQSE